MRIFLAGATGVMGRRLVPMLVADGHTVTGSTRKAERAALLAEEGATPVVVDFMDADAARQAIVAARPEVVIHQLTDLPQVYDAATFAEARERNAQLRITATANVVNGALAAGAGRVIAQSVAFAYASGPEPHVESDPLDPAQIGVATLERLVLETPGFTGLVLRYGLFYGSGTWNEAPVTGPTVHADAAARVTATAVVRGAAGAYNIADEGSFVSIDKARAAFGFDPAFRLV
jgi:nucleoside-diphosphate-sugar epimerase